MNKCHVFANSFVPNQEPVHVPQQLFNEKQNTLPLSLIVYTSLPPALESVHVFKGRSCGRILNSSWAQSEAVIMVEVEARMHEEQTAPLETSSHLTDAPHQSSSPRYTLQSLICLLHFTPRLITGQFVDSLVCTFSQVWQIAADHTLNANREL